MKQSHLSLEHYHLTHLEIEPEVAYSSEEGFYPDFVNASLSSKVGIGAPKDNDESKYALKLVIEIEPKSEGSFPYSIGIGMEGFFTIIDEKAVKNKRNLVLVNGSAMLYGAIRENLLMIMSRFEYGNLMMPTVNFVDLAEMMEKDGSEKSRQAE